MEGLVRPSLSGKKPENLNIFEAQMRVGIPRELSVARKVEQLTYYDVQIPPLYSFRYLSV